MTIPEITHFPYSLSDNLMRYLFFEIKSRYNIHDFESRYGIQDFEGFIRVLNGEDKGEHVQDILSTATRKAKEYLSAGFDILKDAIIEDDNYASFAEGCKAKERQVHEGVCKLGDNLFTYKYVRGTRNGVIFIPRTTIVQQGHTFKHSGNHPLIELCKEYQRKERIDAEETAMRESYEEWTVFRKEHKQEIADWLLPLLQNRLNGCALNGKKGIETGTIGLFTAYDIDNGKCNRCGRTCNFRPDPLPEGEHTQTWYDLGIDKLIQVDNPTNELIFEDGDFTIYLYRYQYIVKHRGEVLRTRDGKIAGTRCKDIAYGLLADWRDKGSDSYKDATSLIAYHSTWLDDLDNTSQRDAINFLECREWESHWTFKPCPSTDPQFMMEWTAKLGDGSQERIDLVREWLHKCSVMQIVAILYMFGATRSLNVAYCMAVCVENYNEEQQIQYISELSNLLEPYDDYLDSKMLLRLFRPFKIYYGVHFLVEGKKTE